MAARMALACRFARSRRSNNAWRRSEALEDIASRTGHRPLHLARFSPDPRAGDSNRYGVCDNSLVELGLTPRQTVALGLLAALGSLTWRKRRVQIIIDAA
jgi:hypothetical protein